MRWSGKVALVGLLLLTVLAFLVQQQAAPSAAPKLRGWSRCNGTTLVIGNSDTRVWTDVRVRVNINYKGTIPDIKPGQDQSVSLSMLVNASGERFDILRHAITSIVVDAEVSADGTRVESEWGFTE